MELCITYLVYLKPSLFLGKQITAEWKNKTAFKHTVMSKYEIVSFSYGCKT
jgi:hypothetical protein